MNARDRDGSTEAPTPLDAEGPLRRWARRRREVAREAQANAGARPRDIPEQAPDVRQSADDPPGPAAVEEKALTDEDMPPLDTLDEDSDYSGFLSPGVSEALRRRALRKLFSSAVFNIPDGLDDYDYDDDDFTSFAALGDIVTSDMKHQAEVEAVRSRQTETLGNRRCRRPRTKTAGPKIGGAWLRAKKQWVSWTQNPATERSPPNRDCLEAPIRWNGIQPGVTLHQSLPKCLTASRELTSSGAKRGVSPVQTVDWILTDGACRRDPERSKKGISYFLK